MCLYSNKKWPKIAWKPIPVYKELLLIRSVLCTPYYRVETNCGEILKAAYKFSAIRYLKNVCEPSVVPIYEITGHGVHAYLKKRSHSVFGFNSVLTEAVIPRFSYYWVSNDGTEIAASRLKIIRKLIIK